VRGGCGGSPKAEVALHGHGGPPFGAWVGLHGLTPSYAPLHAATQPETAAVWSLPRAPYSGRPGAHEAMHACACCAGMQSAGMGYALSRQHFSDVLVAVPSSVSIVVMVWLGAALASVWRLMPLEEAREQPGAGGAKA
jgi:hypothetical protein